MGFSISWLAFHGKSKAEVLASLHLFDTGNRDDGDMPTTCASFPNDWTIIVFNRFDHPYAEDSSVAHFSKGCTVIACHIEEHIMFSAAQLYRRGRMLWSVYHANSEAADHLDIDGDPPAELDDITRRAREKQAAPQESPFKVDYIFDVPLDLAECLCGFDHTRGVYDWGEPTFTELRDWSERQ